MGIFGKGKKAPKVTIVRGKVPPKGQRQINGYEKAQGLSDAQKRGLNAIERQHGGKGNRF